MTLTEFLLARIAEDEAQGGRYVELYPDGESAPLMQHVLAECEAKRRIMELRTWSTSELRPTDVKGRFDRVLVHTPYGPDDEELLALLALPYSNHPDYRDEWKP